MLTGHHGRYVATTGGVRRVLESAGRASGDVKLAVSLSENVPATLEALAAGEITTTYHLAQHSPVLRN